MPMPDLDEIDVTGDGAGTLRNSKKVAISEAKTHLSALVDEVRMTREAVVIHRRNKPAAVLVEVNEYRLLSRLRDTVRTEQLQRTLQGELVDLEEVIAGLDLGLQA